MTTTPDPFADHPWTRARSLARDLAKVLTELRQQSVASDNVVAVIYPDDIEYPISFADREFFGGLAAHLAAASDIDGTPDARLGALLNAVVSHAKEIDPTITGATFFRAQGAAS